MKIFISFITAYFCLLSTAKCQNLIPNASFEDTVSCPGQGQFNKCEYWIRVTAGTPDYFHSCSNGYGVPDNIFGNQQAQNGNAYVGLGLFVPNSIVREYMGTTLIDSLKADSCYHFEMYVSLANANLTTSNIQVFFSDTFYQDLSSFTILLASPQIQNPPGNIFDTLNWKLVSGDFIANGGEKYLIIGNFYPNSSTTYDTLYNVFINDNPYVYIDNVSLTPTVCTSIKDVNDTYEFSVFPNPVTDFLTIEAIHSDDYEIIIYDVLLQQVYKTNFVKSTKINCNHLPAGFYSYQISNSKVKFKTGKFLVN